MPLEGELDMKSFVLDQRYNLWIGDFLPVLRMFLRDGYVSHCLEGIHNEINRERNGSATKTISKKQSGLMMSVK